MNDRNFQVGGDHYAKQSIQPWDIWEAYPEMDPFTASIIKYMLRWPDKGGVRDLEKARHTLDKLIEIRKEQRTHGERLADELYDHVRLKNMRGKDPLRVYRQDTWRPFYGPEGEA